MLTHATLLWTSPQALAPLLAGTLYLPLMLFHVVGLDVYSLAYYGGWPAPSPLG
ncbi:MAG: hypothetical protein ABWY06_18085 [Pseudomonas sp.]|uniref:hypothetical protein n=1 Tax=Pseudomonas sp. TaxID=306 RepID=UPI0033912784